MSEAVQNRCGCPTPVVTNVPGTAGALACTNITADFSVPAFGNNVTVYVVDNSQMVVGTIVMADAPAHFEVISLTGATQCVLQFVNQSGDVAPGTTITVGAKLCPSAGQGTAGTDGKNGYVTSTGFTVPGSAGNVSVTVDDSSVLSVGEYVAAQTTTPGVANFIVAAIASSTAITLTFLDNPGDDAGGTVPASGILIPVGKAGQSSFTNFVSSTSGAGSNKVPSTAGGTMTTIVGSTAWMVVGQTVVIGSASSGFGPATFRVTSITNPTTAVLTWLAYVNDVAGGSSIPSGSNVTVAGTQPVFGTITSDAINGSLASPAYTFVQNAALQNTGCTITIPATGSYLLKGIVDITGNATYNGYNGVNPLNLQFYNVTQGVFISAGVTAFYQPAAANSGYAQTFGIVPMEAPNVSATAGDVINIYAAYPNALQGGNLIAQQLVLTAQQIG